MQNPRQRAEAPAVANDYSGNVSVLLGTGTGSFAKATNITTGDQVTSVAVADLNGDNHPTWPSPGSCRTACRSCSTRNHR